MPISDTHPKIEALQLKLLRSMTGEQRLLMGIDISDLSRTLMKAGIKREHPEWSEKQVMRELIRLVFFPQPLPDWF
jgi:hypothetical protein